MSDQHSPMKSCRSVVHIAQDQDATPQVIGLGTSWGFTASAKTVEYSLLGSCEDFEESVGVTWSISFEGYYRFSDVGQVHISPGAKRYVTIWPQNDNGVATDPIIAGMSVITDLSINAAAGDLISFSVTFKGHGTPTTVNTWPMFS